MIEEIGKLRHYCTSHCMALQPGNAQGQSGQTNYTLVNKTNFFPGAIRGSPYVFGSVREEPQPALSNML